MLCRQALIRLEVYNWRLIEYGQDAELMEHLDGCQECSSLIKAQKELDQHFATFRQYEPAHEMTVSALRSKVESSGRKGLKTGSVRSLFGALIPNTRPRIAALAVLAVVVIIALIPLNMNQKVGYQIAIDGVEREIALENPKITSLLGALGMEQEVATTLLDSLGMNQIHFTVGECTETCRLTIFDLKTERDVRLMVQAIIDLGCCRIDNVAPVFRNETMSLLGFATRKLLS